VTRLFFVLEKGYSRDARTDFDANTSNDTVLRKEVPFGVVKPKSKVSTPIFPQNRHFWAPFRREMLPIITQERIGVEASNMAGIIDVGVDAFGILSMSVGQTNRK